MTLIPLSQRQAQLEAAANLRHPLLFHPHGLIPPQRCSVPLSGEVHRARSSSDTCATARPTNTLMPRRPNLSVHFAPPRLSCSNINKEKALCVSGWFTSVRVRFLGHGFVLSGSAELSPSPAEPILNMWKGIHELNCTSITSVMAIGGTACVFNSSPEFTRESLDTLGLSQQLQPSYHLDVFSRKQTSD